MGASIMQLAATPSGADRPNRRVIQPATPSTTTTTATPAANPERAPARFPSWDFFATAIRSLARRPT
jgi:hypothetical protein